GAEVELHRSELRTHAPAHGDFGDRLAWQLDGGDGAGAVKEPERRFECRADGRLASGQRGAAIDIVGGKSAAEAELDRTVRAIRRGTCAHRALAGKSALRAEIDRAAGI